jgi:hypothetical protein
MPDTVAGNRRMQQKIKRLRKSLLFLPPLPPWAKVPPIRSWGGTYMHSYINPLANERPIVRHICIIEKGQCEGRSMQ